MQISQSAQKAKQTAMDQNHKIKDRRHTTEEPSHNPPPTYQNQNEDDLYHHNQTHSVYQNYTSQVIPNTE
jgi:hypothetical protein